VLPSVALLSPRSVAARNDSERSPRIAVGICARTWAAYLALIRVVHSSAMLHAIMLLVQSTSPTPAIDATPSITGAAPAETPCRMKDRRGRLVGFDPKVCEALVNYLSPPARAVGAPHTLLELVIDPSGKVETCTVVEPSGAPELDARSCSIAIDKARYTASSATGAMQRRTTRMRIEWPRTLPARATVPSTTALRTNAPPTPAPRTPARIAPSLPAEPTGISYDQRLAQGIRGREPTLGWTIGD
jgi:hypothetical protein